MRTAALIVTFNRLVKLRHSLTQTLAIPFDHIIVVNNASVDGTDAYLASLNENRLIVINQASNLGGAGGFKAGCTFICQHLDVDWVFLFDDDAYPALDILEQFQHIVVPEYSVYAGLVKDLKGDTCKMNLPFKAFPQGFLQEIEYAISPEKYLPVENEACRVASLSFVGVCIEKSVLSQHLGSIRTELFIYYDDIYFGHELSLNGFNIRYSPELLFLHDVSSSGRLILPAWKIYYLIRNLILSKKIYKDKSPYGYCSILLRLFKYLLLSIFQKNKKEYLGYFFKGCLDGIRNRIGKQH